MKFGTRIIVRRGSNHHAKNLRDVPGVLIGARGNQVLVRCDYWDGPHDKDLEGNLPTSMLFAKSQVRSFDRIVPTEELNSQGEF
jgi:hypothetical protein